MSENLNGTGRGRQVGDPFVPEEPTQAVRDFFGHAFSDVAEYARMLEEEGELRGLLGPRDMERIWSRHIVNSAAVLDFMPRREGQEVLDVGSGSGLPGIVIAAPTCTFTWPSPWCAASSGSKTSLKAWAWTT